MGAATEKGIPERHRFKAVMGGVAFLHVAWALFGYVPEPFSDAATLNDAAKNIANGVGFVVDGKAITNYTPGWSGVLAVFYKLFGAHLVVLCLGNAAMILATTALVSRLVASWLGERAGLAVALLMGTFPAFFFYQNTANGECAVLFLSSLFLFFALAKKPRVWDPPLLGVTLGVLALTKPELVLWGGVIPLAEIFRDFGEKDRENKTFFEKVKMSLRARRPWIVVPVVAVISLLFVMGWIQRNSRLVGHPAPIASSGGYAIWQTAHEPQYLEQNQDLFDAWARCDEGPGVHDDFTRDACMKAEGIGFIKANPPLFAKKVLRNIPRMYLGSHTEIFPPLGPAYGTFRAEGAWGKLGIKLFLFAYWGAIVVVGFVGIFRLRKYPLFWPVVYAVVVKTLAHAILFAAARYGLHVIAFLMLGIGTFFVPKEAKAGAKASLPETDPKATPDIPEDAPRPASEPAEASERETTDSPEPASPA